MDISKAKDALGNEIDLPNTKHVWLLNGERRTVHHWEVYIYPTGGANEFLAYGFKVHTTDKRCYLATEIMSEKPETIADIAQDLCDTVERATDLGACDRYVAAHGLKHETAEKGKQAATLLHIAKRISAAEWGASSVRTEIAKKLSNAPYTSANGGQWCKLYDLISALGLEYGAGASGVSRESVEKLIEVLSS